MGRYVEYGVILCVVAVGGIHAYTLYQEGLYWLMAWSVMLNIAFVLNVIAARNYRRQMEAWRHRCMTRD